MTIYFFEINNRTVTSFYLSIIIEALKKCGHNVVSLPDLSRKSLKGISRSNAWFLTTGHKDIITLYFKGFRNFIHWFQGLTAEEDYMQTHSQIRRIGMTILDRITARHCSYGFFVSQQLKEYITKKFQVKIPCSFIMPCFNESINSDNFFVPDKYNYNKFCYVGSTIDAWQNFEDIVSIYKDIESRHDNCLLKIITPNCDEAKQMVNKHELKNVIIKSVPQEQVKHEIADCKFGFLLRKNIIVNNVSTPTKLSNYLASGVIPFVSESIVSYKKLAQKHQYLYVVNEDNAIEVIENCLSISYEPQKVLDAYKEIFDTFFNRDLYIKQIENSFNDFFFKTTH